MPIYEVWPGVGHIVLGHHSKCIHHRIFWSQILLLFQTPTFERTRLLPGILVHVWNNDAESDQLLARTAETLRFLPVQNVQICYGLFKCTMKNCVQSRKFSPCLSLSHCRGTWSPLKGALLKNEDVPPFLAPKDVCFPPFISADQSVTANQNYTIWNIYSKPSTRTGIS